MRRSDCQEGVVQHGMFPWIGGFSPWIVANKRTGALCGVLGALRGVLGALRGVLGAPFDWGRAGNERRKREAAGRCE